MAQHRCRAMITVRKMQLGLITGKDGKLIPPQPYDAWVPCPKGAKTYYRVVYSSLDAREGAFAKNDDVIGFCLGCAPAKATPDGWIFGGHSVRNVHRVRGPVSTVTRVEGEDPGGQAKRDAMDLRVSNLKTQIRAIMNQRGNAAITIEDWNRVFDEVAEEWLVEKVMNS